MEDIGEYSAKAAEPPPSGQIAIDLNCYSDGNLSEEDDEPYIVVTKPQQKNSFLQNRREPTVIPKKKKTQPYPRDTVKPSSTAVGTKTSEQITDHGRQPSSTSHHNFNNRSHGFGN